MPQDGPGSEEKLLSRLRAGHSVSWQTVFERYGPPLLAYAIRMLGNRATAEEILQDSLVNIYQTIDTFEGQCSLKSWLYRAVRNRAIDEIRRSKRFVDVGRQGLEDYFDAAGRWQHDCPDWDGLADRQLDDRRALEAVARELFHLPHDLRDILLLKEVEGLEPSEICAALDISPGNMRLRLHRARAALRAAMVGE